MDERGVDWKEQSPAAIIGTQVEQKSALKQKQQQDQQKRWYTLPYHGYEVISAVSHLCMYWNLSWSWMNKKKSIKCRLGPLDCQSIHLWCVALSEIYIFTCLQLCWSALLESPNHLKTNQQSKMNLQLLPTDNSYESKQSFAFESHDQHITTEMNVWFA